MALIDDIRALPAEILATRSTQRIADALPAVVKLVTAEFGKGTIIAVLGLNLGNTVLDAVAADPEFRHITSLLDQGRLDASLPIVRDTLDTLTQAGLGFTAEHAAVIKSLAEKSIPVAEQDVRKVCWSDAGQWLV